MEKNLKIVFIQCDLTLESSAHNEDRLKSISQVQAMLNTWITTGVLVKQTEVVLSDQKVLFKVLLKK
jgi:hypothetical protein